MKKAAVPLVAIRVFAREEEPRWGSSAPIAMVLLKFFV